MGSKLPTNSWRKKNRRSALKWGRSNLRAMGWDKTSCWRQNRISMLLLSSRCVWSRSHHLALRTSGFKWGRARTSKHWSDPPCRCRAFGRTFGWCPCASWRGYTFAWRFRGLAHWALTFGNCKYPQGLGLSREPGGVFRRCIGALSTGAKSF